MTIVYISAGIITFLIFTSLCDIFKSPPKNDGSSINLVGFGKAGGVYMIKAGGVYIVAGIKIRSKKKAIKEFTRIIEDNDFLPPDTYFKMIKMDTRIGN